MTRLAATLLALLLAAPAFAACTDRSDQAMSCAQGTMWDSKTSACVPVVVS